MRSSDTPLLVITGDAIKSSTLICPETAQLVGITQLSTVQTREAKNISLNKN